jgi:multiple sugar transport system substrate-binding protein
MSQPKKVDRRKFIYAGLGAVALVAIGAATYLVLSPQLAGPKKLTLMMFNSPETDWIKSMAEEYQKRTGVEISFDVISRETYWDKLDTTLLSKGSEVDLVTMHAPMLGDYAKSGAVQSLSSYIDNKTLFPYDKEGYIRTALDATKYKNEIYGLPLWFSTEFLYYRKDLIKDESALKTWDGYLETAKRFTKTYNPSSPTEYGATMFGKKHIEQVMEWYPFYWSFGGRFPKFNSKESVEATQFYVDLFLKHKVVPPDADTYVWEHTFNAFKFGKVALSINWDANYLANWHETYGENLGITTTPAKSTTTNPAAYLLTWVIAVNAFSKMKEEAFKFAAWLTADPDAVTKVARMGLPVPSNYILNDAQLMQEKPHWKLMVDYVSKYGFAEPATPGWLKVRNILMTHLADAMVGAVSPQDALDAAQKEVDEALRE